MVQVCYYNRRIFLMYILQIESLKKALANKEAQGIQLNKTKEPKSPCEKPRAVVAERTPSRPRRLSIENYSTKTEKQMNIEDRKGTPSVPIRSRRLSLEGPKDVKKDNLQIKMSDDGTKPPSSETVSAQKYRHIQDADAVTKPWHFSNGGSMSMDVSHAKAPRSPTSANYQKRFLKTNGRTQIPNVQLPKTPETSILTRNEVQVVIPSELSFSKESQTPNLITGTNGKGSQIRRSLRTIGKLINGSEKR